MTNYDYVNNVPNGPNDPADDQPDLLVNTQSISGILNQDHVGFKQNDGGTHKRVTFSSNNVPSTPVNPPQLFTQLVNSRPQLFWYSGNSGASSTQYQQSANGSTFLLGGIILKWGQVTFPGGQLHLAGTVNFTSTGNNFPNNCYSVVTGLITSNVSNTESRNTVAINSPTTTSFDWNFNTNASSSIYTGFYWIAIGN